MDEVGERTLKIMETASWYNNWLFSMIKPYLKGEILEIGAGIGSFTHFLSKSGEVTAIDLNPEYIERLQKLIGKKVGFGDIERGKYFFKNKKFDSVICLNVLEHIREGREALSNMNKLLKPRGRLILLVPAHQEAFGSLDKDLGHFRRYSKKQLLEELVNSGFKVYRLRYLNWLGAIGWFVNARILKRKLLPKNQLTIFDKLARPFLIVEKFIEPPFGLSLLVIAEKK